MKSITSRKCTNNNEPANWILFISNFYMDVDFLELLQLLAKVWVVVNDVKDLADALEALLSCSEGVDHAVDSHGTGALEYRNFSD